MLDGIPESVVIGVSLLSGGTVSMTAVIAIFLSNIPEGLSSASGMKNAGRSAAYIFGLWTGIAAISGLAALLGYVVVGGLGPQIVAAIDAVAAGAILSMIADTMIPEAFEANHNYAGLVTVIGFLLAFGLSHLGAASAEKPQRTGGSRHRLSHIDRSPVRQRWRPAAITAQLRIATQLPPAARMRPHRASATWRDGAGNRT